MVANGYTDNGYTKNVEVIDLENPGMSCQDLMEYPLALEGAATFLNFEEEPEICGGGDSRSFIYYKVVNKFYCFEIIVLSLKKHFNYFQITALANILQYFDQLYKKSLNY